MLYCIDFNTFNTYKFAPLFLEIKEELLSSLKIDNVNYFGELPDNDSDGQDELLSNSTYLRIIFEQKDNYLLEDIINLFLIYFQSIEPKEIILRTDFGETKTDTYIEIYI